MCSKSRESLTRPVRGGVRPETPAEGRTGALGDSGASQRDTTAHPSPENRPAGARGRSVYLAQSNTLTFGAQLRHLIEGHDLSAAYKVWTHDYRSPIQGGPPIWDGTLPYALPAVAVDDGPAESAAGWNASASAADALAIAGMCPTGRPSILTRVEENGYPVLERGRKLRSASWIVSELVSADDAIRELSRRWFAAEHADAMAEEQIAWRVALARPHRDATCVEEELHAALRHRGLSWGLRRFDSARAARAARTARAARAAMAASAAWATWTARAGWAARAARAAWTARAGWVAWDVWDVWDVWDAWPALSVQYASRMGWIEQPADLLTLGIRDAYEHGLAIALPTGPTELGWAMEEDDDGVELTRFRGYPTTWEEGVHDAEESPALPASRT